MSLALIVCRCGRRWYQLGRRKWDSRASTPACGGCRPDLVEVLTDWSEL